jgi:hypothetical protein
MKATIFACDLIDELKYATRIAEKLFKIQVDDSNRAEVTNMLYKLKGFSAELCNTASSIEEELYKRLGSDWFTLEKE